MSLQLALSGTAFALWLHYWRKTLPKATPIEPSNTPPLLVLILGGPGVGKGTLCRTLVDKFKNKGIIHIDAGQCMRQAKEGHLGPDIAARINFADSRGELLDGHTVMQVIGNALLSPARIILLDGFPRTAENHHALEEWLTSHPFKIVSFSLEVSDELAIERIAKRGISSGRPDDQSVASVRQRLQRFRESTIPMIDEMKHVYRVGSDWTERVTSKSVEAVLSGVLEDVLQTKCFLVALTGGPAGGKTTLLESCRYHLQSMGFHVILVPEIARIFLSGGASLQGLASHEVAEWEVQMLKSVFAIEDSLAEISKIQNQGCSTVLLCDRGAFDVKAHLNPNEWNEVLRRLSLQEEALFHRYHGVIHLQSLATGSPEIYTRMRAEDLISGPVEWAQRLDAECARSWSPHSRYFSIASSPEIQQKMQSAKAALDVMFAENHITSLPVRLLVTAESFGFGPSAAAFHIVKWLRPRVSFMTFCGRGHSLDFQSNSGYDLIVDLDKHPEDELVRLARQHDAILVSSDWQALQQVQLGAPSCRRIFYDPLTWFWREEMPASVREADLYLAQDFFNVKATVQSTKWLGRCQPVVVPPIVPDKLTHVTPQPNLIFVNLGGLQNPFLTQEQCIKYARTIATAVRSAMSSVPHMTVRIAASRAISEGLKDFGATTVTPDEAQALLGAAAVSVLTCGLGNILDCSALIQKGVVFWLPPANDSQGQQLRFLLREGLAPLNADWEDIDYFRSQEGAMAEIAKKIDTGADCSDFQSKLEQQFRAAFALPPQPNPVASLCKRFGRGGDIACAELIEQRVLVPLTRDLRRHVNGTNI